ncbi:hypothetical protein AZE42_12832 [Rhizopogon vesiculosus]|uniref:Uncharacterized protein n=1 Tax=Rhizopogon vesiculosus TaxID=180088 RepID=A0A1J8QTD2_9AGAM|nr:hypothetical protein AZE42_12832 [Rhizopogon vesiculosus]
MTRHHSHLIAISEVPSASPSSSSPTRASSPTPSSSSSSSSYSFYTPRRRLNMTNNRNAVVEQLDGTKPPVLTAGLITPEIARAWEQACRQFFLQKKVPEEEQVKHIAWGMHDPRLQDWYLTEQDVIDNLSFDEYMLQLQTKWLEADWQGKVRNCLLGAQQGMRNFYEWAVELQSINALLCDDPSHLSLLQLHEKVNEEEDFYKWLELVKRLDEKLQKTVMRQQQVWENYACMRGYRTSSKPSNQSSSKMESTKSYNTMNTQLHSLTTAERELLKEHTGCFKCRKFYVAHRSADCPDGFPLGEGYKMLTECDALRARSISKKTISTPAGSAVNVVMPSSAVY